MSNKIERYCDMKRIKKCYKLFLMVLLVATCIGSTSNILSNKGKRLTAQQKKELLNRIEKGLQQQP